MSYKILATGVVDPATSSSDHHLPDDCTLRLEWELLEASDVSDRGIQERSLNFRITGSYESGDGWPETAAELHIPLSALNNLLGTLIQETLGMFNPV